MHKVRKYSMVWYIKKYWLCVAFWFAIVSIGISACNGLYHEFVLGEDTQLYEVESPKPLKPLEQPKLVVKVEAPKPVVKKEPSKPLGNRHFSRGSYTERRVDISREFSNKDVVVLASILECESPNLKGWDRRLEANVVLNRYYSKGGKSNGITIKSIIEAGNGTQFNGIRNRKYRAREYSQASYDAAYAVLIKGERVLASDILYFCNTSISNIRGVEWVLKQNHKEGHSFGR